MYVQHVSAVHAVVNDIVQSMWIIIFKMTFLKQLGSFRTVYQS